jgi:hypothetical protein
MMRRAIFLACLFALPSTAISFAEPTPVADPPPAAEPITLADRPTYRLALRGGDTLQVIFAESRGHGSIRYVTSEITEGFLVTGRIISIRDSKGFDLSERLIVERRAIGKRPVDVNGRDPSRRSEPQRFRRFLLGQRGTRPRDSKRFWISEVGLAQRVDPPPLGWEHRTTALTFNVGGLGRVGGDWALGAVGHVTSEGDFTGWGVGFRGRRWVGDNWSLEGTVGVLVSGQADYRQLHPLPPYVELAANLNDRISFFTSVLRARWDERSPAWMIGGGGRGPAGEQDNRWRIGIRTGSVPLWAGIVANVAGLRASREGYGTNQ